MNRINLNFKNSETDVIRAGLLLRLETFKNIVFIKLSSLLFLRLIIARVKPHYESDSLKIHSRAVINLKTAVCPLFIPFLVHVFH